LQSSNSFSNTTYISYLQWMEKTMPSILSCLCTCELHNPEHW